MSLTAVVIDPNASNIIFYDYSITIRNYGITNPYKQFSNPDGLTTFQQVSGQSDPVIS